MRRPLAWTPLIMGLLWAVLHGSASQAAPVLELNPRDGAVAGAPDATVGWGFTLYNTDDFLVVTGADFESTGRLGTFTDFISGKNFFVVGPGTNTSTIWSQPFSASARTGIGSFRIDRSATVGTVLDGVLVLTYDLYSRSPFDPAFDPDTDTLSNGNLLQADARVAVAVPEPASAALMLAGIAGLGVCARWRARRSGAARGEERF